MAHTPKKTLNSGVSTNRSSAPGQTASGSAKSANSSRREQCCFPQSRNLCPRLSRPCRRGFPLVAGVSDSRGSQGSRTPNQALESSEEGGACRRKIRPATPTVQPFTICPPWGKKVGKVTYGRVQTAPTPRHLGVSPLWSIAEARVPPARASSANSAQRPGACSGDAI